MKKPLWLLNVLLITAAFLLAQRSRAAAFGGVIWYDEDCDGTRGAVEHGVGGMTVEVLNCADDSLVASLVTEPDGSFTFSDGTDPSLPVPTVPFGGTYRVCFTNLPSGYGFTKQTSPPPADGTVVSTVDPTTGCTPCFTFTNFFDLTLNNAGLCQGAAPPPPACLPVTSCIESDLKVKGGGKCGYVWFHSVVKISGTDSNAAMILFDNSTIQFSIKNVPVTLTVPPAIITFDPSATNATTTYNTNLASWVTTVPVGYCGNVFLSGVAYKAPGHLPGCIKSVTWCGDFSASVTGLTAKWKWGAGCFPAFCRNLHSTWVKPTDSDCRNRYHNSDCAGAIENLARGFGDCDQPGEDQDEDHQGKDKNDGGKKDKDKKHEDHVRFGPYSPPAIVTLCP